MTQMTSEYTETSVTTSATTSQAPLGSSTDEHVEFNLGLIFVDCAGRMSEAESAVLETNADVVSFLVEWEDEILDNNNAALEHQITLMPASSKDDNANTTQTIYSQMATESQGETDQMSGEQSELNSFAANAEAAMESMNNMVSGILQQLNALSGLTSK